MEKHGLDRDLRRSIAAALGGALIFVLVVFGSANINPLNTDWVTTGGGDNLQHYIGWRFFRNAPWSRQLLFDQMLNYPVGTSVIVTDSNPLLCLVFKLFRSVLPAEFQFNGIWILSCYLLIALFAVLILWKLSARPVICVLGAMLAVLNPVVLQRALIHDNLCAHWLILAAILLFLNRAQYRKNAVGWMLLALVTLLIHFYFIPMIAFILALQMLRMFLDREHILRVFIPFFAFGTALGLGYYFFGYRYIIGQSGSFGELSMNLNAFFNPDGTSSILGNRPTLPLQYEGFNYFGLGMLFLCLFAVISGGKKLKKVGFALLPCAALILLAASNNAYFDLTPLWNIALPESLSGALSAFRSSGRLVWPIYYLCLFASLHFINGAGQHRRIIEVLIVCLCFLLQCVDLHGFIGDCRERFHSAPGGLSAYAAPYEDDIPAEKTKLFAADGDTKTVDSLALLAADRGMTFNRAANARGIVNIYHSDAVDLNSLTCADLDPDAAYIYLNGVPESLTECAEISGYVLYLK